MGMDAVARTQISRRAGMPRTVFLAQAGEIFGIAVRYEGGKDVAPSTVVVDQSRTGASAFYGVQSKSKVLGNSAG